MGRSGGSATIVSHLYQPSFLLLLIHRALTTAKNYVTRTNSVNLNVFTRRLSRRLSHRLSRHRRSWSTTLFATLTGSRDPPQKMSSQCFLCSLLMITPSSGLDVTMRVR